MFWFVETAAVLNSEEGIGYFLSHNHKNKKDCGAHRQLNQKEYDKTNFVTGSIEKDIVI